jgi:hypothetical protein
MSGPAPQILALAGMGTGPNQPLQRSILAAGYTKNQVPEASVPKRSNP